MPQMAPSSWVILFIYFNLIMIYIISYNNFNNIIIPVKNLKIKKNFFLWKW